MIIFKEVIIIIITIIYLYFLFFKKYESVKSKDDLNGLGFSVTANATIFPIIAIMILTLSKECANSWTKWCHSPSLTLLYSIVSPTFRFFKVLIIIPVIFSYIAIINYRKYTKKYKCDSIRTFMHYVNILIVFIPIVYLLFMLLVLFQYNL